MKGNTEPVLTTLALIRAHMHKDTEGVTALLNGTSDTREVADIAADMAAQFALTLQRFGMDPERMLTAVSQILAGIDHDD